MPLSNHRDRLAHFWLYYLNLLKIPSTKDSVEQRYIHHPAAFVQASAGRRPPIQSAANVGDGFSEFGRIGGLPGWQFSQAAHAVRNP